MGAWAGITAPVTRVWPVLLLVMAQFNAVPFIVKCGLFGAALTPLLLGGRASRWKVRCRHDTSRQGVPRAHGSVARSKLFI